MMSLNDYGRGPMFGRYVSCSENHKLKAKVDEA